MSARVWSSTFVGRSAELAELDLALDDAVGGQARIAFVAGDAGVGKTRLVSEFAARARARGIRVLSGDCVDLGGGELPYAPIVAVLRSLSRERDPVLQQIPDFVRAELATLLPALGDDGRGAAQSMDESGQGRLFEALLWLLDRVAQDAPALVALEDLHWADQATRAFVAFLGRNLGQERVLVVATYRADELHRRHPLRPLLAELERVNSSRRIAVPALTRDELSVQLRDLLDGEPDEELVQRVYARSEGYPLFVEELVAASADGRGPLPSTLRDALMGRVERLPAQAQAVMRVLAVGQWLDDGLLVDVAGLEQAELNEALREGVAHHILAVGSMGGYGFRHALLREVVRDDLLPGEQRALDLRIAGALERRAEREGMSPHLAAAIANHFASAGDDAAALQAAVRAAGEAERVHAYGQAAALLERALELFDRVGDAEALAGADRVDLLGRAAVDHKLEGDSARQEALARAALALVDERAEPRRAALLLDTLQEAQWHQGRGEESLATLELALSLLPPDEISAERGTLLSSWGKTMMLRSRHTESVDIARETLAVADALGDPTLRGRGLNTLGTSLIELGDVDEGAAALREALALATSQGLPREQNSVYINLGDALHLAGRLAEARAAVEEGLARKLRPNSIWLRVLQGELATEAGEFDRAQEILWSIEGRPTGNSLVNLDLRRAELALGRGEAELARELLDEAARVGAEMDEPQFTAVLGALRAELERREGRLVEARVAVREALDSLEAMSEEAARRARVNAVGTVVEADAAQRARDLGDAEASRAAVARADAHLAEAEAAADGNHPLGAAWLLVARAERGRAAGRPDPSAYGASGEAWAALGRPYPAAVMRFRQAEALVNGGDRAAATAVLAEADETAGRLGAGWLRGEIDGLVARARLRVEADRAAPVTATKSAAGEDPFGLTHRERQVLELVARGATNREIGDQLFMAEKTASVHVSRILAKLGVRSRTEAAGVAHRLGLAA
ncbi:MAG TPA: AAA family ATPase [Solirubrobacteraceae bacterium]|nr:AAA family ATPase [Solirubrobacteraceae bacterium]